MKSQRVVSVAAILAVCCFSAFAQETSIDLRKDGRILTSNRKNHFMRKVTLKQIQLSDSLYKKLSGTTVNAIVVPPGKTGDKHLIGVLIGSATLPDDWVVNEKDFEIIRDFSRNSKLAQVEKQYYEMRAAIVVGNNDRVASQTKELRTIIGEGSIESDAAESYAGYLLQEFDSNTQASKFSDLITKYRQQETTAVHSLIVKSFGKNNQRLAAISLDESEEFLMVEDLKSFIVQRQPETADSPSYVRAWKGRTLIIVTEKPGDPFSVDAYKGGLGEYVQRHGYMDAFVFKPPPMKPKA